MEEKSTLARPYAVAVFKLAQENDELAAWSEMLGFLASVVRDPIMLGLIADPRIEEAKLADLVIDIAAQRLSQGGQNLVRVLADNGRLGLAEEILRLYERERARAEKREKVTVISAYAITPKFKKTITEAMEKRLGCKVELDAHTDRSLIGGVVVRAGDLVIDASLKGRLRQLGAALG